MLLTPRLLKELKIHVFVGHGSSLSKVQATEKNEFNRPPNDKEPLIATETPQLSKDEYRLLFKMLQAIGHEFSANSVHWKEQTMVYRLAGKNLFFDDVNLLDSASDIHLARLTDLLGNPELKRPVWEKLKALNC